MSRILIVDDDPVCRDLLGESLSFMGYETRFASDGLEALELLEEETPDLILMDLAMPRLDGFGTIRRIRGDSRFVKLPVIAVTAHAMQDQREEALALGFNEYFTKPVNPMCLLNRAALEIVSITRAKPAAEDVKP
ncbi:MAG: response regulator [Bryobacteraceae bacterium]